MNQMFLNSCWKAFNLAHIFKRAAVHHFSVSLRHVNSSYLIECHENLPKATVQMCSKVIRSHYFILLDSKNMKQLIETPSDSQESTLNHIPWV